MSDKDSKCFVPDCNRSVGVLFPRNIEIKNKWLRQLGLEHCRPGAKSFICLKHFGSDGQPSIKNKKVSSQSLPKPIKIDLTNEAPQPLIDPDKLDYLKKLSKSHVKPLSVNHKNVGSESDEVPDNNYHRGRKCRLCLTPCSAKHLNNVFDKLTESVTIAEAVAVCLVPLQISAIDKLSKYICSGCADLLLSYHKFHVKCLENDRKQRVNTKKVHHKSENDADSENSDEYLHEERLSDLEADYNNTFNESSKHNYSHVKNNVQSNEDLIKVLEGNDEVILTKVKKPPPISHNDASVDEESHYDSFNEGDEGTEDIIIEMVEDSDQSSESPPSPPIDLPENITIKRVENGAKKPEKRKIGENGGTENGKKKARSGDDPANYLPGGSLWEDKSDVNTYSSPLGTYEASRINYVMNSRFVSAGKYLYKFGLRINHTRRLQCLRLQCPGEAVQRCASIDDCARTVTVLVGHNHPEPDDEESKREMFYYLLYLNMKRQKHFNFKTHYDEMCKLDPTLLKHMPIREVVKEICRQGPVPSTPKMHTFNELHVQIEKDIFNRLQFTDESVQFYQARFETNDGSKGLIFANEETIERHSFSQVMYVDATFVVKTEFPIHLVTVLALHDHIYYPVCFVIVNKHSQELYRKIFRHVRDSLAPKWRPDEIVTEYEANLYYALGEIYNNDSIIGGSVFSYAQNIYKHVCSLNLARELELNARFRAIFHLLLILPLFPVNSIPQALNNIEKHAKNLQLPREKTGYLFRHVRQEWIEKVDAELFSVHRAENRISENLGATFKKLRESIVQTMNVKKTTSISIESFVSKLMELDKRYSQLYSGPPIQHKLQGLQRKMILRAWDFIESDATIKVNMVYKKVAPYVKCLENQLWIWGMYKFENHTKEMLIDRKNFMMDEGLNAEAETDQNSEEEKEKELNDGVHKGVNLKIEVKEEASQEEADEEGDQEGVKTEIVEEYYLDEGGEIRKINPDKSNSQLLAEFADEIEKDVVRENLKKEADPEGDAPLVELFEDSNGACYVLEDDQKRYVLPVEENGIMTYVYQ